MVTIGDFDYKDGSFYSPTMGRLSIEKLLSEVVSFVKSDNEAFYSLVIGSDSQTKNLSDGPVVNFVTAVVVHRHGTGGRYFWRRQKDFRRYSLREKIYRETLLSIELALDFVPKLRVALEPSHYELEIHVDVGNSGPTRELIKEVVGMVNGNGFTAKTKPDSYGAFVVADKHT